MIRFHIERWGVTATVEDGKLVESEGTPGEREILRSIIEDEPHYGSVEPDNDIRIVKTIGRELRSEVKVLKHTYPASLADLIV